MSEGITDELDFYIRTALAKKAEDPVLLDVRGLTSYTDYFLIVSGRSHRQVTAIAEYMVRELKKSGIKPLSEDGTKEGHWVLLDYGHIVVHVFYDSIRRLYDLEGLWVDAKRMKTPSMLTLSTKTEAEGDVEEIIID